MLTFTIKVGIIYLYEQTIKKIYEYRINKNYWIRLNGDKK